MRVVTPKSFAWFQTSPDFKGIKTSVRALVSVAVLFQTSPDFKGIKTLPVSPSRTSMTVPNQP